MAQTPQPAAAWTSDLKQWLRELAVHSGFDTAGVAPVATGNPEDNKPLDAHRFEAWIEAGRAGEMDYLKRRDEQGVLLRSDVQIAMPWARSVIVCALNYNASAPLSIDESTPGTGWIARYAWSGRTDPANPNELAPTDYHDELLSRLKKIESQLHERFSCQTRCYVDTGPLVERSAAAKAGIGWVGKNTCILDQKLGSWLLLGVIITSIPVSSPFELEVAADRCGSCTRCLDACPTNALVAPREMDASLCIAYLTIEKKGVIAEELREPIGRQVFGCDICQDVCPWNRRSPISQNDGMLARRQLINPPLAWLAEMDSAAFKRWFKGSPLERTRLKRLHRNVAIAMGNTGDTQFLPQLEQWSAAEDLVLAESSQWAIARIHSLATPHDSLTTAPNRQSS
ncbi:tRNA epoxyqueuosine(34) reductase QueG [Tunturibacter empetritectus]|uniref:Epoxyqueuosine reductase n=2 Tax=Tunturiibacter empetritectus TaxID=3069691 RepID=A0A7W8IFX4_9BACT|nr:tRNA epoxyqueuosine(34) reductase QueG [Edaphobacter lichenicola]MBB5316474.1 epoxyqueuosine reductase [Edaphobacter lichenicola]